MCIEFLGENKASECCVIHTGILKEDTPAENCTEFEEKKKEG